MMGWKGTPLIWHAKVRLQVLGSTISIENSYIKPFVVPKERELCEAW